MGLFTEKPPHNLIIFEQVGSNYLPEDRFYIAEVVATIERPWLLTRLTKFRFNSLEEAKQFVAKNCD